MPLIQTVANFPDIGVIGSHPPKRVFLVNTAHGVQEQPVSCHAATTYRLLTDHNGSEPQPDANALLNASVALRRMIPGSKKLTQKDVAMLAPGSVIVFAKNGAAEHSCVALDTKNIAGYNQHGWFANGKIDDYSSHLLATLSWGVKADADKIIRSSGGAYDLYQVTETSAKGIVASY